MWPVVLGQLNLPRRIRNHFENLILVGIIPSQVQGAEPKHLDPYLEVLVDELIYLTGCKLYDAYQRAPFTLKVEVVIYILDYQGLESFFLNRYWFFERVCVVFANRRVLLVFEDSVDW